MRHRRALPSIRLGETDVTFFYEYEHSSVRRKVLDRESTVSTTVGLLCGLLLSVLLLQIGRIDTDLGRRCGIIVVHHAA